MKRLLPVLLALSMGCVTVPASNRGTDAAWTESPAERNERQLAEQSFEKLRRAWVDGEALVAYGLMSVQAMSDWVLERSREQADGDWPKRIATLDGVRKIDLAAWTRLNRKIRVPFDDARAEILPETILHSVWLRDTWVHYFTAEKDSLRAIANEMKVSDVYVEGGGMSVLVKIRGTVSHIYSMTLENGVWKYEYAVRPASRVKR